MSDSGSNEALIEREFEMMEERLAQRIATIRKEVPVDEDGNPIPGPEKCVECDGEMPELRQKAGYKICVPCKTLQELEQKQYAR